MAGIHVYTQEGVGAVGEEVSLVFGQHEFGGVFRFVEVQHRLDLRYVDDRSPPFSLHAAGILSRFLRLAA